MTEEKERLREQKRLEKEKAELEKQEKRRKKEEAEAMRLQEMLTYERMYDQCEYVCGVDEVGRGPLAGPVVTAAVILPKELVILYVNDSKKLSEKRREELYPQIMEKALGVGIGIVSPGRIDEINILQATFEAMRQAVASLPVRPDMVLVDGNHNIPDLGIPQQCIIKGDAKSMSIACASIIAKVTRDRMMVDYDTIYPEYGFASNKGYGSAAHIEAIKEIGPSPIHRSTFIKNFI